MQNTETISMLYSHTFKTPLGDMLCIADEQLLHFLDFVDSASFTKKQSNLRVHSTPGKTSITDMCEQQVTEYFAKKRTTFTLPLAFMGTEFQKKAWQSLLHIPYGHTISYQQQARSIQNIKASRAVGSANGMNRIAIIVPCHRVIHKDGKVGNYNGGQEKKKWLLEHEKGVSI
jgi:AraC family transcriptional regulator of adaptative response/methylated-DNA-[protein]-cysteine methyltransferase